MKIIDAHLHLFPQSDAIEAVANAVGHSNSTEHLKTEYARLGIVHGVVMGNRSLEPAYHDYPESQFKYCVGLDSQVTRKISPLDSYDLVEENLKRANCCGVKLYPGYDKVWLTDPMFNPIYELAQKYDKPVAIHTGLTAYASAHLKYSHPLVIDEVAADHRKTQFVMCHFGNPFMEAAVAVLEKNRNVSTDLSGLLEGPVDLDVYFEQRAGYVGMLRTWLNYLGCWDRVMFGTDWPIVNLESYIEYTKRIIPEQYYEKVFFENANRIYRLGL